MLMFLKNSVIFIVVSSILIAGCSNPAEEKPPDFLVKTDFITINSSDFSEELDLKKAAYPYNIDEDPAEYNEMVIHLVKMLSEEIVLLSAAADKGVDITGQELQAAEDEFKKDYPGDSFEQILLKNAISYSFWKKGFKENMIVDKLIDQELKNKIEITSEDIVQFYRDTADTHTKNNEEDTDGDKTIEDENQLVSRLRMKKTQEYYDEWVQQLRNTYPVTINKEKLKTFLIDVDKSEGRRDAKEN